MLGEKGNYCSVDYSWMRSSDWIHDNYSNNSKASAFPYTKLQIEKTVKGNIKCEDQNLN